jgi:hypothetical protein
MTGVTTNFALISKRLLLSGLRKLALQRVLLSTVAFLFSCVSTLTLRQGAAFPSFVQRDRVNLMNLTVRTVSLDFFGNIHANRIQLSNRETHAFLYLFRTTRQKGLAALFRFRHPRPPSGPTLFSSFLVVRVPLVSKSSKRSHKQRVKDEHNP